MRTTILGALFALGALALAAGCGGGSGSGGSTTPTTGPTATPTPTYIPTGAPATTAPVGSASPSSVSVANGNYGVFLVFPATTSGSGTMTVTGSTTVPNPPPAGITAYTPASGTTLFYVLLQPSATVVFPSYPQLQLTVPPTIVPQNNNFFGADFTDDAGFPHGSGAWYAQFLGAAEDHGQVLTFPNPSTPLTFTAGDSYVFAIYEVPT